MPGNKAVIYEGAGNVAVETTDYPTFELKDGPG
jgi:glutathione-independent formaldehyde dehydrogenase